MLRMFSLAALAIFVSALVALAVSTSVSAQASGTIQVAQASQQSIDEKEAFEAAKELGTIEAWEAFLNNFPKGFRADLARAYVRRLGTQEKKEQPAPAAPVRSVEPKPSAPPQQAATPPPPPPPPAPPLSTVDMGAGTTPWRTGNYELDEGNTRTTAAIVDGRGIRLAAYCSAQRTIPFVISDLRNGVYPDFDKRVEQGMETAGGAPNSTNRATVPLYVDGRQQYVQVSLQGLSGELLFGDTDAGFSAGSPMLESIMAGNSMTLSLPPFVGTFQLNNSRATICGLLRSCGMAGAQRGCSVYAPRPVVNTPAVTPRPRPRPVNCTAGRVFSSRLGKCVCPRSEPHWYGGRCRHERDCPGDSVLNSRGQCVKEDEPPPQNTFVPDCPGGQERNAQGQCVPAFNLQNEAIKLQCDVLLAACNLGSSSACKKAQSACDRG